MSVRDRVNPVLERELRQRLRGRAAWVSLTMYLIVLGLILRLVFDVATRSESVFGASQVQAASGAGRSIYHWLLFVMLGLICFIVPGLTAGAIAGERERQTLVPLQITLLSPRAIVFGKLLASLAFVVLLVIAALPFLSVSFLLGGVAASEVMKGVGMVLVIALAIAALSLACSSAARRTQTATVTAYALVGMLVIGTLVIYGAQRALDTSPDGSSRPTVLLLNPFAATAEVVRGRNAAFVNLSSPFTPFQEMIATDAFHGVTVDSDSGSVILPGPVPMPVPGPIMSGPATTAVVPRAAVAPDGLGVENIHRRVDVADAPTPTPPPAPAPAQALGGAPGEAVKAQGILVTNTGVVNDIVVAQPVGPQFGRQFAPPADPAPEIAGVPFWLASLGSFLILATLGLLVAVRKVSVPARGRAE